MRRIAALLIVVLVTGVSVAACSAMDETRGSDPAAPEATEAPEAPAVEAPTIKVTAADAVDFWIATTEGGLDEFCALLNGLGPETGFAAFKEGYGKVEGGPSARAVFTEASRRCA